MGKELFGNLLLFSITEIRWGGKDEPNSRTVGRNDVMKSTKMETK